ncbi:MAG: hypothetical protein JRH20_30115 [Deltaproteobacteria bacterium]|nr:hypothetical protein [Deltaproteobacteria bacterium]
MNRLVLLTALLLPALGLAKARVGVLPVGGARLQAAALDAGLGHALANEGAKEILGPAQWVAQVAIQPEIAHALGQAEVWVAHSREYELQMKRTEAVDLAKRATALLKTHHAGWLRPKLVLRAELALAQALFLEPADPAAAAGALRRALHLRPEWQPARQSVPPRVLRVLDAERRAATINSEPTLRELSWLAAQGQMTHLVYLRVRVTGAGHTLRVKGLLFAAQQKKVLHRLRSHAQEVTGKSLLGVAADVVAQLVAQAALFAPQVVASQPASQAVTPMPAAAPSPWYHSGWFWGALVLAGATAGVVTYLTLREEEGGAVVPPPVQPVDGPFTLRVTFE